MMTHNYQLKPIPLQALTIPTGWTVAWNSFYAIDPDSSLESLQSQGFLSLNAAAEPSSNPQTPTVPSASAPSASAPPASAPSASVPSASAPSASAPSASAPSASVPSASAPSASAPSASAPSASAPSAIDVWADVLSPFFAESCLWRGHRNDYACEISLEWAPQGEKEGYYWLTEGRSRSIAFAKKNKKRIRRTVQDIELCYRLESPVDWIPGFHRELKSRSRLEIVEALNQWLAEGNDYQPTKIKAKQVGQG